jgi:hypothetical protein
MKVFRRVNGVLGVVLPLIAGLLAPGAAAAGPVVREGAGAGAAAIQSAVDAFRNDLGNPNNGNAPGTQPGGRREINWDGGGAAAPVTLDPSPMNRFANRGAVFVTSGRGFEISGQPTAEFGDLNPLYPGLFAPFSSPRLFAPLGSNVMDVLFFVPNNTAVAAAVTGFGAVFTGVDSETSTKLEFYAPDGALLFERFVPYYAGTDPLSFLGVSFNSGELVGRVRIISGNTALGPDQSAAVDPVAMDDFFYAEPMATQGLAITPGSGRFFRSANLDVVIGVQAAPGLSVVNGAVRFDNLNATAAFLACVKPGTIVGGGQTFRCTLPQGGLTVGDHVLQVELTLSDQSRIRNAVRLTIVGNTEP